MSSPSLPYSQACENNKPWILPILQRHFLPGRGERTPRVLEIGGGTGQHAVYFAEHMPWLSWQSSDVADSVSTLALRIRDAALDNLPEPIVIDALDEQWDVAPVDYVFSANSLHIMSVEAMESLFEKIPEVIRPGARVAIYGPFRYGERFTSHSNADFDRVLRQRDPRSGIRDAWRVDELASAAGLRLIEDNDMPANNQLRVWAAD